MEEKVFERGDPLSLWYTFKFFSFGTFKWPDLTQGLFLEFLLPLLKKHHWFHLQPWDGWMWNYYLLSLYVPGSILDALRVLSHINHSPNYASDGSENLISLPSLFQGHCSSQQPLTFQLRDPWDKRPQLPSCVPVSPCAAFFIEILAGLQESGCWWWWWGGWRGVSESIAIHQPPSKSCLPFCCLLLWLFSRLPCPQWLLPPTPEGHISCHWLLFPPIKM